MATLPVAHKVAKHAILDSAARTATGTGDAHNGTEQYQSALFTLSVTAASGTSPTLNVYIQAKLPDDTNWTDIIAFPQLTSTGRRSVFYVNTGGAEPFADTNKTLTAGTIKPFSMGHAIRVVWTIGGTNPSFTFAVTGNFYQTAGDGGTSTFANSTDATTGTGLWGVGCMLKGPTNWRTWGSADGAGDNAAGSSTGMVSLHIFDGTNSNFNRVRDPVSADASDGSFSLSAGVMLGAGATVRQWGNAGAVASDNSNGATTGLIALQTLNAGGGFDRLRNNSAGYLDDTTQSFNVAVALPGEWTEDSSVAAAGTPSAVKAAGAAGVRHVCRNLSFTLSNVGAGASGLITIVLRDGASGAGTIKRTWRLNVPAGQSKEVNLPDLNIFGTAATAMTLESTAALPADVSGTCSIGGYSTV